MCGCDVLMLPLVLARAAARARAARSVARASSVYRMGRWMGALTDHRRSDDARRCKGREQELADTLHAKYNKGKFGCPSAAQLPPPPPPSFSPAAVRRVR